MRALALVVLAVPAWAWGAPGSYTFGGFSPGEREYWKRGADDQLCSAPATCRPVEKKDVKGFVKPPRSRRFAVAIDEDTRIRLSLGDRDVGSFAPGGRVSAVNGNVFVAPGEGSVAVEYELLDKGQKRSDVVVFDLAPPAPPPVPAPGSSPSPAAPPTGNAFDRAMAKGGVWEQRQVPCDQAGVTLTLKKTKKFGIRIATKCQGQKDVTDLDGSWATEGQDTLVLSFAGSEGDEKMVCRFAACAEDPEDCLTCTSEDVSFTMRVVRR